jgi:DNA-binding FadR family transcriptional regulator
MRRHAGSQDVFLRENERFHQLVAEASGSVSLRVFSATLKSIATGENFGVEYQPENQEAVARAHGRILAALRKRQPAAAERAMQDHLGEAATYWQRRYPELWSRPVRWIQS